MKALPLGFYRTCFRVLNIIMFGEVRHVIILQVDSKYIKKKISNAKSLLWSKALVTILETQISFDNKPLRKWFRPKISPAKESFEQRNLQHNLGLRTVYMVLHNGYIALNIPLTRKSKRGAKPPNMELTYSTVVQPPFLKRKFLWGFTKLKVLWKSRQFT